MPAPPDWEPPQALIDLLDGAKWTPTRPDFMPEHPHEWLRRTEFPEAFEAIVAAVAEHGYKALFLGQLYEYVDIDGRIYWHFRDVANRARRTQ